MIRPSKSHIGAGFREQTAPNPDLGLLFLTDLSRLLADLTESILSLYILVQVLRAEMFSSVMQRSRFGR